MADPQQLPMTSRATDMAHDTSMAMDLIGPRTFTGEETLVAIGEFYRLETILTSLSYFVSAHKVGAIMPAGDDATTVRGYICEIDPVASIEIGPLVFSGAKLTKVAAATKPSGHAVTESGTVTVKYGEDVITTVNLTGPRLHAMIRALSDEVFHAMSSLIEELAASMFKGVVDRTLISEVHFQSLLRLQDKYTSKAVSTALQTPILTDGGLLDGEDEYMGRLSARDMARPFLTVLTPNIATWVFGGETIGTRIIRDAANG